MDTLYIAHRTHYRIFLMTRFPLKGLSNLLKRAFAPLRKNDAGRNYSLESFAGRNLFLILHQKGDFKSHLISNLRNQLSVEFPWQTVL